MPAGRLREVGLLAVYRSDPMLVALATPRVADSVADGLEKIRLSLADAAARGAEIVCFPEAYLPYGEAGVLVQEIGGA